MNNTSAAERASGRCQNHAKTKIYIGCVRACLLVWPARELGPRLRLGLWPRVGLVLELGPRLRRELGLGYGFGHGFEPRLSLGPRLGPTTSARVLARAQARS